MDSELDHQLALQLMLEDLAELEDQQKGKQRAGEPTDIEMAIEAMKSEIVAAQLYLQDRILATRAGAAMHAETIPEADHQSKITMNNANEPSFEQQDTEDASHSSELPAAEPMSECDSCLEQRQIFLINACNHQYCYSCIRELFLGAIRDEELYPPRCCSEPFPPDTASQVLNNNNELEAFNQKTAEYTAENRVYCAEPGCSAFIPQSEIQNDLGTCPACQKQTHLPCNALAHPGVDCPLDNTLQDVLSMANTQGWQRCYNCRAMVELNHGCNHITCRCGKEFCYECGSIWKNCGCPLWHERRLFVMANQAVDHAVEANAEPAIRQDVFNQVMEVLAQHEDVACRHHEVTQWVRRHQGDMRCETCHHEMTNFIFQCRNCMAPGFVGVVDNTGRGK